VSLAQNYGQSNPSLEGFSAAFAADWALAQSLVPEPGTISVFAGVAGVGLLRRRRHDAQKQ
jgi:hypothetical protein